MNRNATNSSSVAMICSCPTPSHTPQCMSYSRPSTGLRSRLETPLFAYLRNRNDGNENTVRRGKQLIMSTTKKLPLSVLASATPEAGYTGGCFNATTRLKMVPLPSQHVPQLNTNKGLRGVRLHTRRYNPTLHTSSHNVPPSVMDNNEGNIKHSDSMADLQKLKQRQEAHFKVVLEDLEEAKQRRATCRVMPHRAECFFYMNGHSANINRKPFLFPMDELKELQLDSISQNKHLYYGRGVRGAGLNKPPSRAITKLQEDIKNQQHNSSPELEITRIFPETYRSRGQTPSVSFAIPTPPPPMNEDRNTLMSAVYGKRATFITEDNSSINDTVNENENQ